MTLRDNVDIPQVTSFYRYILGRDEPLLDDLKEVDPVFHKSLCWIADPANDITNVVSVKMRLRVCLLVA